MEKFLRIELSRYGVPILWMILLCLPMRSAAQTIISGVVKDAANESLPGVNVIIKGTTTGTATDADGKYSLEVSDANATLIFSAIGYATKEEAVAGRSVIDVALAYDVETLNEVVVMGYGTARKADITSAVSVVDMKTLGNPPASNPGRLLLGQAPGVQVRQTQGKPGSELEVRIRGIGSLGAGSEPLYVVDGFPVGTAIGQTINPADIESITVLKDAASTAIYGARGSNGVVLITTKSARPGVVSLTLDANAGIQSIPQNRRVKMMNGQEFARFKKESFIDRYRSTEGHDPDINEIPAEFRYPEQTQYSTDWFDKVTNNNAGFQNYNLTASVGQDNYKTLFSVGYLDQQGVVINTGIKRYNARINTDYKINKFISAGVNVALTHFTERYASTDLRDGLVGRSLWADPRYPVYNADGTFNNYIGGTNGVFGTVNPVQEMNEMDRHLTQTNVLANGYMQVSFLKHFRFKTSISATLVNVDTLEFRPSTLAGTGFNQPPPRPATEMEGYARSSNWAADQLLTYTNTIGDHNLDLMAGYTAQEAREKYIAGTGNTYPDDVVKTLRQAKVRDVNSGLTDWSLLAYFGRASYAFKDRYLLSASYRREGSSRFGTNSKWGNFPAASIGWRLTEEEFMPKPTWLSDLKVRASWGVTGNNNIGDYRSVSRIVAANYVLGNSLVNGKVLGGFANSNLGWEQSRQTDLGMDLALFQNKVTFVAEFYRRTTDNMLLEVQIPAIAGFNKTFDNVGKVENKGMEYALGYRDRLGAIGFRGNFNIAFNRNKVLAIEGGDAIWKGQFYEGMSVSRIGRPVGMITGYKMLGIFNTPQEIAQAPKQDGAIPGVYRYLDANHDGTISYAATDDDMVEIGNPYPDFTWALTLGADYKGFDLNILFTGAQNYDVYRTIESTTMNMDGVFNVLQSAQNRWRSAEQPGDGVGPTTNTWKWERESNSRYVYDASHMWVKNISLGYTFPKIAGLNSVRVFVNAENVALITNYPGGNPETNLRGGTQPGFDDEVYPLPSTYTVGASIKF